MNKAVDILCHCRQTLQYTYAFAFYLKKNNQTFIFEVLKQSSLFTCNHSIPPPPSHLSPPPSLFPPPPPPSPPFFQDNQADLEMATERLSEYLERELSLSSLSDLKISVQDKTKSVSSPATTAIPVYPPPSSGTVRHVVKCCLTTCTRDMRMTCGSSQRVNY